MILSKVAVDADPKQPGRLQSEVIVDTPLHRPRRDGLGFRGLGFRVFDKLSQEGALYKPETAAISLGYCRGPGVSRILRTCRTLVFRKPQ